MAVENGLAVQKVWVLLVVHKFILTNVEVFVVIFMLFCSKLH